MREATPSRQETVRHAGFDGYSNHPPQASAIRAIQRQRGEEPCFSTDKRYDCTKQCEWRNNCIKLRAVWLR